MEHTEKINAKLNLSLYVKGVTENGYHLIDSFVTSIDIYDEITVTKAKNGEITLKMLGTEVDCRTSENNAYKAAVQYGAAYEKRFGKPFLGCNIVVDKHIPVGAGLGGSSADACGVVNALFALDGLNGGGANGNTESFGEFKNEILKSLGSDTVYMARGGFAEISGLGNEVKFLSSGAKMYFVLALPDFGVSSGEAYKLYDLKERVNKMAEYFYNALYEGVAEKYPKLMEIKAALSGTSIEPTGVSMSGSGSCMFAVYGDVSARDKAFTELDGSMIGVTFIKAESV